MHIEHLAFLADPILLHSVIQEQNLSDAGRPFPCSGGAEVTLLFKSGLGEAEMRGAAECIEVNFRLPRCWLGPLPEGFHSPPWGCTALHGATGQPDPEFRHVPRRGEPGSPWFRWPPTAVLWGMAVGHLARLQPPEQCMGWARSTKH